MLLHAYFDGARNPQLRFTLARQDEAVIPLFAQYRTAEGMDLGSGISLLPPTKLRHPLDRTAAGIGGSVGASAPITYR